MERRAQNGEGPNGPGKRNPYGGLKIDGHAVARAAPWRVRECRHYGIRRITARRSKVVEKTKTKGGPHRLGNATTSSTEKVKAEIAV